MRFFSIVLISFFVLIYPIIGASNDVLKLLRELPDVAVEEITQSSDTELGFRKFDIKISQPIDHLNPNSGRFLQRVRLYHRGFSEPMHLRTSGYSLRSGISKVSNVFETNQLDVEHRYFGESVPDFVDWGKLNVQQSAEDFHHIVTVFKKLYSKKWVSSGTSKGGMTSIYNRRYYPEDVDGTLAYVAPHSLSSRDPRYRDFLENIGGEDYADCRLRLDKLQQLLLQKKSQLLPFLEENFSLLGSKELAYEYAVVDFGVTYWQFSDPRAEETDCNKFPNENTKLEDFKTFFENYNFFYGFTDDTIADLRMYAFQEYSELGGISYRLDHLRGLLNEFDLNVRDPFIPKDATYTYSHKTVEEIGDWVAKEAHGIMFLYGGLDPWTAGAFDKINPYADNHLYFIPKGNHTVSLYSLSNDLKKEAFEILERWFNKKVKAE